MGYFSNVFGGKKLLVLSRFLSHLFPSLLVDLRLPQLCSNHFPLCCPYPLLSEAFLFITCPDRFLQSCSSTYFGHLLPTLCPGLFSEPCLTHSMSSVCISAQLSCTSISIFSSRFPCNTQPSHVQTTSSAPFRPFHRNQSISIVVTAISSLVTNFHNLTFHFLCISIFMFPVPCLNHF